MADDSVTEQYKLRQLRDVRKCHRVFDGQATEIWATESGHQFSVPKDCDKDHFDEILAENARHFTGNSPWEKK